MRANISAVSSLVKNSALQTDCEHRLAAIASRAHSLLAPRATVALVALFRALDLPPGSEVLMPVMLCANPAHAVRLAGLSPLFADIDPDTFNLDLQAAERVVNPNTRVILAVPLFGHPLDVSALEDFAAQRKLIIIEDAAQAVGLFHSAGIPAGSLGTCSVYSFGPGKIAGAGGGAAILSDDPNLLDRARLELARLPSAHSTSPNSARILAALDALPNELAGRAELATSYKQTLDLPGVTHPKIESGTALWKYSVLLPDRQQRDAVTRALLQRGVPATNLYPPLAPFFRGNAADYPVALDVATRIVNLPLWPQPPDLLERTVEAFNTSLQS
jgi:perosamine synthetase